MNPYNEADSRMIARLEACLLALIILFVLLATVGISVHLSGLVRESFGPPRVNPCNGLGAAIKPHLFVQPPKVGGL